MAKPNTVNTRLGGGQVSELPVQDKGWADRSQVCSVVLCSVVPCARIVQCKQL
jgi:hypothetical protein